MATVEVQGVEGMQSLLGQEIGPSEWLTVTQDRIDLFADRDRRPPVDPRRRPTCRHRRPFGTTIAHGYLTLSLIHRSLAEQCSSPSTA